MLKEKSEVYKQELSNMLEDLKLWEFNIYTKDVYLITDDLLVYECPALTQKT